MKIIFDHQIFSGQVYGGISRYFIELAKNISDISHISSKVTIFAPFYRNRHLLEAREQVKLNGLYLPDIPRSGRVIGSVNNLISDIRLGFGVTDIIHETYYSDIQLGSKKIKRVLTVYDMIHEIFPSFFSIDDTTSYKKKLAIERADHVIAISESTKSDLVKILGVNPEKISVIPLGIGSPVIPVDDSYKLLRPYILYVGQRGGYKNFHGLIRAYANSPQVLSEFDVVCFGGGPFTRGEISFFDELKLNKNSIHQVGGSDNVLAHYYINAAAFIYPSLYEGFGIPPLEAMSYGCPVACSSTSSMPEVVGDAAIMFDPSSLCSIRDSLDRVLYSHSTREHITKNGFKNIRNFSWKQCASKTIEQYKWLTK